MNAINTAFSATQRTNITALCATLGRGIGHPVTVEHDATECGQHYAALCVASLPLGAHGKPGPLVSLLPSSESLEGIALMGFDGTVIESSQTLPASLAVAHDAGIQAWLVPADGAMH